MDFKEKYVIAIVFAMFVLDIEFLVPVFNITVVALVGFSCFLAQNSDSYLG